jgi:hypothetical protein
LSEALIAARINGRSGEEVVSHFGSDLQEERMRHVIFALALVCPAILCCKNESSTNQPRTASRENAEQAGAARKTRGEGLAAPSGAASATYAHVVFTGIVTFMHQRDGLIVAEMPSIPIDRTANFEHRPIHKHKAFLVVDLNYHKVTPGFGISAKLFPPKSRRYAIFDLDDVVLSVWDTSGDVQWTDTKNCGGSGQTTDYTVIPHIGDHDCTRPLDGSVPVTASVRIAAPNSTVIPYLARPDVFGFALDSEEAPKAKIREQISQVVDWSFPNSAPLVIYAAKHGSPVRNKFVTIERVTGNGDIAIVVGNAPPDELEGALDPATAGAKAPDVDHHFEVYYDHCATPVHDKRVPVPIDLSGCIETAPVWMPDWVWPVFETTPVNNPNQTNMLNAAKKKTVHTLSAMQAVVGSVNCGPDQVP